MVVVNGKQLGFYISYQRSKIKIQRSKIKIVLCQRFKHRIWGEGYYYRNYDKTIYTNLLLVEYGRKKI